MGPDYIGPAVDHFQEITAQYPEVKSQRNELLELLVLSVMRYPLPVAGRLISIRCSCLFDGMMYETRGASIPGVHLLV